MPFKNEQFDRVVSQAAINLVPDKLKAFEELSRVIRKNGILAISDAVANKTCKCKSGSWVKCVSGAVSLDKIIEILEGCRLNTINTIDLSDVVAGLVRKGLWDWNEYLQYNLEYWVLAARKI